MRHALKGVLDARVQINVTFVMFHFTLKMETEAVESLFVKIMNTLTMKHQHARDAMNHVLPVKKQANV